MGSVAYSSAGVAVDDHHGLQETEHSSKRDVTTAGLDYNGASTGSLDDGDDAKRRQPMKRACNECRQQKVRN